MKTLWESGVSCIICSFNGSERISRVLDALKKQEVANDIPWEVIVVDNASTDGLYERVKKQTSDFPGSRLRVVREPEPGLTHARKRGISEARFEFISFIDDDNYVEPSWISKVFGILENDSTIGACGGQTLPIYDSTPDAWCSDRIHSLAVGKQQDASGKMTGDGHLWGAGMTVRRSALDELSGLGFKPLTVDRQGTNLTSGGDTELCYALKLVGWDLWYQDDLLLHHEIPASRLQWEYFLRLYHGFGRAEVLLAPYRKELGYNCELETRIWWREVNRQAWALITTKPVTWYYFFSKRPGKYYALKIRKRIGRIAQLLKMRDQYEQAFAKVARILVKEDRVKAND